MIWTYFYQFGGEPELCLIIDLHHSSIADDNIKRVQLIRPNGEVLWRERMLHEIHHEPFILDP